MKYIFLINYIFLRIISYIILFRRSVFMFYLGILCLCHSLRETADCLVASAIDP